MNKAQILFITMDPPLLNNGRRYRIQLQRPAPDSNNLNEHVLVVFYLWLNHFTFCLCPAVISAADARFSLFILRVNNKVKNNFRSWPKFRKAPSPPGWLFSQVYRVSVSDLTANICGTGECCPVQKWHSCATGPSDDPGGTSKSM